IISRRSRNIGKPFSIQFKDSDFSGCRGSNHFELSISVQIQRAYMPDIPDLAGFPEQFALMIKYMQAFETIVTHDDLIEAIPVQVRSPDVVYSISSLPPQNIAVGIGSDQTAANPHRKS